MVAAQQNSKAIEIVTDVLNDPAIIRMQKSLNEVKAIQLEVFQVGVHYGPPYKNAKNNTLLKPGATFLQQKFGLREHHERIETTIHVNTDDLSKSYIIIQNRCRLFNSDGLEVAQADAACTTFEDKYLFRGGNKKCPTCGGEFIIKGKVEYGGGWLCYKAKGGCGAKFKDGDSTIEAQDTEKKLNDNPLNMLDTIVAMAQKRASVRATIKATGVDSLFSPGDGVVMDYYDDVAVDQPIVIADKDASISNVEPPSSDLSAETDTSLATSKDNAETAKSRFGNANGGKNSVTFPATSYRYQNNLGKVKAAVQDLYHENGKLNTTHMENSIKHVEEIGLLDPNKHTVDEAIKIVRDYKSGVPQEETV